MKELMLMAATMMPEEKVLEDLQEAIVNYQVDKSHDNKQKLVMHLHLGVLHMMTDGSTEKMHKIMQQMKQFDQQQAIFKPTEN